MKRFWVFLTVFCILSSAGTTFATITTFTNESAFLSAIDPGYYLEDFDSFSMGDPMEIYFSFGPVNGFDYEIGGTLLKPLNGSISVTMTGSILIYLLGSDVPITAVGGNFFLTEDNGQGVVGPIQLTATTILGDYSMINITNADSSTFIGFITDDAYFLELEISHSGSPLHPTVDHLYVGEAIPAPGALLLGGIGAGFVGWLRRRRTI